MTKNTSLALLVVDVSEDWEEVLKAHERGFFTQWNSISPGGYTADASMVVRVPLDITYPHGSVRAGFNAIIDTVRIAHQCKVPIFSVHMSDGWSDGDEVACQSLQPYIPEQNQSYKGGYSAFVDWGKPPEKFFAAKIQALNPSHLLVLGYDRDCCVLESVKDAVVRGYSAITSEHCMLTKQKSERRDASMLYYRENTQHIESLVDVWNCILRFRDNANV